MRAVEERKRKGVVPFREVPAGHVFWDPAVKRPYLKIRTVAGKLVTNNDTEYRDMLAMSLDDEVVCVYDPSGNYMVEDLGPATISFGNNNP